MTFAGLAAVTSSADGGSAIGASRDTTQTVREGTHFLENMIRKQNKSKGEG